MSRRLPLTERFERGVERTEDCWWWKGAVRKRRWARGEEHWNARLTLGDVERIRDLLSCRIAQRKIGAHIGCTQGTVDQINRRKGWT